MIEKYLFSVGNVVGMVGNDIVFTSKTLSTSGVNSSLSATEVRGGEGNALQNTYYHSSKVDVSLTDVQFRLEYFALNTGSKITQGGDIFTNETVLLNGYVGTIKGNPTNIDGNNPSVWIEVENTFRTIPLDLNTKTFNLSGISGVAENSVVCVKYLDKKDSARTIKIPANFIPQKLRLFITAKIFGSKSAEGEIGYVQIEIPSAQLSGTSDISMNADGYSNSSLTAVALAYTDSGVVGCSSGQYYAKITEYLYDSKWYDGVTALAIEQGDFTLSGVGTKSTLRVYAVKPGQTSFLCDNSKLTFESSNDEYATIGQHTGIVNTVSSGSALLTAYITENDTIETSCTLTVEE